MTWSLFHQRRYSEAIELLHEQLADSSDFHPVYRLDAQQLLTCCYHCTNHSEAFDSGMKASQQVDQLINSSKLGLGGDTYGLMQNQQREVEQALTRNQVLENLNRELEQFRMLVSHRLKEEVRNSDSLARLMQHSFNKQDSDKTQYYLGRIAESTSEALTTLDGLLELSRISARHPKREDVRMQRLSERLCEEFGPSLHTIGGSMEFDLDNPSLYLDPADLHRILHEFISNSIEYRDRNRPLEISVSYRAGSSFNRIEVRDNGKGIEAELRGKLFDLMSLKQKVKDRKHGIGLQVCQRIASKYEGYIECRSMPGNGSTFVLNLPTA